MAHTFVVAAAEKLRAEDARTGHRAEDAQVEHKDELIGNSDAGHLSGTHGSDHDVVQHVYKVREAVLDHNGKHQQ